jgi:hypothetical protein
MFHLVNWFHNSRSTVWKQNTAVKFVLGRFRYRNSTALRGGVSDEPKESGRKWSQPNRDTGRHLPAWTDGKHITYVWISGVQGQDWNKALPECKPGVIFRRNLFGGTLGCAYTSGIQPFLFRYRQMQLIFNYVSPNATALCFNRVIMSDNFNQALISNFWQKWMTTKSYKLYNLTWICNVYKASFGEGQTVFWKKTCPWRSCLPARWWKLGERKLVRVGQTTPLRW